MYNHNTIFSKCSVSNAPKSAFTNVIFDGHMLPHDKYGPVWIYCQRLVVILHVASYVP